MKMGGALHPTILVTLLDIRANRKLEGILS